MVMPEIKDVSKPIQHLILFDRAATAKHFGAIEVFDAQGKLTVDASTLDPLPKNRADEEFFQVHRDNPDAGLYISRPTLHRGAYSIVLSRRITGADGSFQGVVAGSIRFTYFHELFGRLQLGEGDTICVLRHDRTVIMRRPFDLDVIGKKLSDLPRGKVPTMGEDTAYTGVGPVDDVPRLYVRAPGTSPLVVIVGKPVSDIFALWRTEAIRIGAIMMALIVFVLAVTLFLAREIRRRAQAEDKLEELATTDALTGLRNRRKFDEVIDSEWRRALPPQDAAVAADDRCRSFQGLSTTPTAIRPATRCWSGSRSASRIRSSAPATAPRAMAARNSRCCCRAHRAPDAMMVAETIRRKVQGWSRRAGHFDGEHRHRERHADGGDGLAGLRQRRRQGALRRQGRGPQLLRDGEDAGDFAGGLTTTVMPRESGASSIPETSRIYHHRLGVLDHPLSRMMTPHGRQQSAPKRGRHSSRYFFISARRPSRRSARAMP